MNSADFDRIVAGFYRAATGGQDWSAALEPVQQAMGARAAVLHTLEMTTGRLLSLRHAGPDLDQAIYDYVREYHRIDPRRDLMLSRGPNGLGRWNHDHEDFSDSFIARNRFYRDFLTAYDGRRNANVTLAIGPGIVCGFILELHRERGPLDSDERDVMRRLGVHMGEALHAYERLRALAAQAVAGHGLLRAFGYPMWLIDLDRFVLFENDAGREERGRDQCAALRQNRLVLRPDRADRELSLQLTRLVSLGHGSRALIDMRQKRSDPPMWLHLSLLVPEAVMGAFGDAPQVVATLFDPARVLALDPMALVGMFGLTPMEAKVATRLAEGLTVDQFAAEHGIAVSTVRAHVRSLLAKFGAQRMVDVVRLLRQGEALWARAGTVAA